MGCLILPVSAVIGGLSPAYRRVVVAAVIHMFHVESSAPEGRKHAVILRRGREIHGGAVITYVGPLLAVIVGIFHAAIAPVIVIGGVKPNLVLVAVVLVTSLWGFLPGSAWAFVAGLTANLLVSDPLGSIPLGLLVVAALTAGGARLLGRASWVYPVLAAAIGSIVADAITLGLGQLVGDAPRAAFPMDLVLGAAALNAVVAGLVLIPVRLVAARYVVDEAAAW